jgi:hypothetical protein
MNEATKLSKPSASFNTCLTSSSVILTVSHLTFPFREKLLHCFADELRHRFPSGLG